MKLFRDFHNDYLKDPIRHLRFMITVRRIFFRSPSCSMASMSLNMLIETPTGFDYTGAGCRSWMSDVGFRKTYVEHLVGPDSMVVGIK